MKTWKLIGQIFWQIRLLHYERCQLVAARGLIFVREATSVSCHHPFVSLDAVFNQNLAKATQEKPSVPFSSFNQEKLSSSDKTVARAASALRRPLFSLQELSELWQN